MTLALVIPALNEGETIGLLVTTGLAVGQVIVVDDGSSDGTADEALAHGATVIRHRCNQGYDRALSSGFAAAERLGVGVVVTMDADGQHGIGDVRAVSQPVVSGQVELSLGVRLRASRWSEALFNRYVDARFDVPDILCGIKGFSMSIYRRHRRLVGQRSIGTALALAGLRERVPHAVIPVTISPRRGVSRFGSGLGADRRILAALGSAMWSDLRQQRSQ